MAGRFEPLADTVAPAVLLKASEVSRRLSEAGVPHALIGGLAVGVHGYPRATKDVDFLVGVEAFESMSPFLVYRDDLNDLPKVGVVDLLAVPSEFPALSEHLIASAPAEIPVIPVEALILLKLHANRPQDRVDVTALLKAGANVAEVQDYLHARAPELASRFAELLPAV